MATEDKKRARRASRSSRVKAALATVGAALGILAPSTAFAQQSNFYLDRLMVGGAPEDSLAMWRPQMAPQTRFFGQLALGFGLNPFRIENMYDGATQQSANYASKLNQYSGAPVRAQLITYVNAGVEIQDFVSVQALFPLIAFQTGNPTSVPQAPGDAVDLKPVAPMDMRLDARVIAYRTPSRSFKLGVDGSIWIPTGNKLSFGGDPSLSGMLGVAAELDLKSFFLLFNTGVQFRPNSGLNEFRSGSEWRWGLGGFLPLRGGALRLGAQIFGSTGLRDGTTFDADNTPLEWMVEGRFALDKRQRGWLTVGGGTRLTSGYAPDFRLVAALGYAFPLKDVNPPSPGKRFKLDRYAEHGADTDHDGLPDDIDLCPTEPEDGKPPNPDDGCPQPADRDGDGIPDSSDKCPDTPEDFDKVDDQDGCPEDDPDKDGIGDAEDACPKEPGEQNPDAEKNGCPQFIRRIQGSSEIQILKKVEFATGKSTILAQSFPILDEVVRLLKVNPEIKHLSIEGHTDNRGSDDLNEKLSNDRAHAVMQYLIDKGGIAADRLSAQGFGPKRPIADNNTNDGRQKNRRVEFHITDQGAGAPTVEQQ